MKTGSSEPVRVAMLNDGVKSDADGYLLELYGGEFVTVAERKRREPYTDPYTRIMWARNGNMAGKQMKWQDAMKWVKTLNEGGYSDWRLPKKEELENFARLGGSHPAEGLNSNGFNSLQSSWYWSSTEMSIAEIWIVHMRNGNAFSVNRTENSYVWPVRDVAR